jgi:hypothetical protein
MEEVGRLALGDEPDGAARRRPDPRGLRLGRGRIDTLADGKSLEQILAAAVELRGREGPGPWQGSGPDLLLPATRNLLGGRGGIQLLVCADYREPGCDAVGCAAEVLDDPVV